MLDALHLLRPWWLLALIPLAIIAVVQRRHADPSRGLQGFIAPHLLKHLTVEPEGGQKKSRFKPAQIIFPLLALAILALAGPAWRREPSPFADEQAGLMILLKVTPSMEAQDVQPTRLERSRHKIRDLLALRSGAPTGLIAYAGSAHLVMPLTRDPRIIEQMADSLAPEVMPVEGDALDRAIALAEESFERSETPGSIVVIADGISPGQIAALGERGKGGSPVLVLGAVGSPQAGAAAGIDRGAAVLGAPVEYLTVDDADVKHLNARVDRALAGAAALEGEDRRYKDDGYLLVPVLALGMLIGFRRGWRVKWN